MFVVAIVMVWFAAGSIWNVRKGKSFLRWMQGGLHLLCERTTVRWLGTTAVELVLSKPKPPFEEATLVIFLEPRDVPWLWGFSRSRGRRASRPAKLERSNASRSACGALPVFYKAE